MRRFGISSNLAACLVLFLLFVSCDGSPDRLTLDTSQNSDCVYIETPGTATIDSVEVASDDDSNCIDAVVVLFSFVTSTGETDESLLYQLNVGEGLNPNATWAESKGLVKGATFSMTLKELTEGSCSPLTYEFSDLDLSDYEESCF